MEGMPSPNAILILNLIYKYKWFENPETIAKALSVDVGTVESVLRYLEAEEFIEVQEGGVFITAKGEKFIDDYFSNVLKKRVKDRKFLEDLIHKFKGMDYHLKTIVMRLQVKADSYEKLLEVLEKLNNEVKVDVISPLTDYIPWMGDYGRRLDLALSEVKNGNEFYLVREHGSYYNVWYEMKDDIYRLGKLFSIDTRPVILPDFEEKKG